MGFEKNLLSAYRQVIGQKYPHLLGVWPIINGYNMTVFSSGGWYFLVLHHTGHSSLISNGEGDKDCKTFGVESIDEKNLEYTKKLILAVFARSNKDIVFATKILKSEGTSLTLDASPEVYTREINYALKIHEKILGQAKMKICLRHKGKDKSLIRDFNSTLKLFGFDTWLDEEALVAGANPNRDFEKGVKNSCAVVFFITENFKDETFLSDEIDFALNEKRDRGEEFSIITLRFGDAAVPDVLKRYIYKEPKTHLEALREIIRALPIQVGDVEYRS